MTQSCISKESQLYVIVMTFKSPESNIKKLERNVLWNRVIWKWEFKDKIKINTWIGEIYISSVLKSVIIKCCILLVYLVCNLYNFIKLLFQDEFLRFVVELRGTSCFVGLRRLSVSVLSSLDWGRGVGGMLLRLVAFSLEDGFEDFIRLYCIFSFSWFLRFIYKCKIFSMYLYGFLFIIKV
jgi:hypothetical protein